MGLEAVLGLVQGRGDGKACVFTFFPFHSLFKGDFGTMMQSVRSLCGWPDSEQDPAPTNILTDLDTKSSWVYEDTALDTPE